MTGHGEDPREREEKRGILIVIVLHVYSHNAVQSAIAEQQEKKWRMRGYNDLRSYATQSKIKIILTD